MEFQQQFSPTAFVVFFRYSRQLSGHARQLSEFSRRLINSPKSQFLVSVNSALPRIQSAMINTLCKCPSYRQQTTQNGNNIVKRGLYSSFSLSFRTSALSLSLSLSVCFSSLRSFVLPLFFAFSKKNYANNLKVWYCQVIEKKE